MIDTEDFTFRVMKSGLKVIFKSGASPCTLSYPMWDAVWMSERVKSRHSWASITDPKDAERKVLGYGYDETMISLSNKGIAEQKHIQLTRHKHIRAYSAEREINTWLLTEHFGEQLLDQMPACPDREDWPVSKPLEVGLDNVRPTKAQKKILRGWPAVETHGVALGENEGSLSWWVSPPKSHARSYVALEKMGLISPGLSGVDFKDGVLTRYTMPDGELAPDAFVHIVYRLTVHGALLRGVTDE